MLSRTKTIYVIQVSFVPLNPPVCAGGEEPSLRSRVYTAHSLGNCERVGALWEGNLILRRIGRAI